ncbi:MAG: cupin domain-containing protein [Chloroflexota bacterium]|nr:cupin domain-containing protein [Chloroflexota bacterium]
MSAEENPTSVQIVGPTEGRSLLWGFAVYKLLGEDTGGAFSVIEHNLQPRTLAAPMHTHRDVDEMSCVLEGEIGARIGDQEVHAGPGTLVLKPKGIPHTFWNAGPTPARLLEVIWPAGFERYFEELDQLLSSTAGQPDPTQIVQLADKHGMEMDMGSLPELMEKYDLKLGG